MGGVWSSLVSLFYTKRLDLVVIGLSGSGKTTFAQALELGKPVADDTAPTVGLEVKTWKRKGVACRTWDLGGQATYRSEWSRYTRGCNVICFVIDTQAPEDLRTAKQELHRLLEDRDLGKVPLLILANKVDLGPKITEKDIIVGLNLDYVVDNPWLVIPISAKLGNNVDKALKFLLDHAT